MKRGRYNRPFLHITTMGVLAIGVLIAPAIADTYPLLASNASAVNKLPAPVASEGSVNVDSNVFSTDVSNKIRTSIITYTVQRGDTISTIADKFGISTNTIRWENNLTGDDITVGDDLRILPVTGVSYKVQPGDTVYTIAKKFNTDPQGMVDFPLNDFANPETFSLVAGQILIVPGGTKSSTPTYVAPQAQVFAGAVPVTRGGWFFPVQGLVTQYPSWYHMALDIAGSIGTPVYAAHSGTVERVSVGSYDTGYGNNVWINDGDGIETHYAHLSEVSVSVGQQVTGGQSVIGARGNTGRSTGPHTHFEVRVNGTLVNPLGYVNP